MGKIHPSVARIVSEATATKVAVVAYAPNATGASGFFPDRNHPNLHITFKTLGMGQHFSLDKGRVVHIQYIGDHFGGTLDQVGYARKKGCLIVSAIGNKRGGKYTAVVLDYAAENGGRLVGDGYFSWKGTVAGASGDYEKATQWFASKVLSLFGLGSLPPPNRKKNHDLFVAANLSDDNEHGEAADVAIIAGRPELNPAAKLLKTAGMDFSIDKGLPTVLSKIPIDINHQHLLQRALDELKSDGIIDFDIFYDKNGKMNGVTVQLEHIDSDYEVAIIEHMKNTDMVANPYADNLTTGFEIVHEGLTFRAARFADGDGDITVCDGGVFRLVGEYEKGELTDKIRVLAKTIKARGIMETVQAYCGTPING
jgi:hypothetical protein